MKKVTVLFKTRDNKTCFKSTPSLDSKIYQAVNLLINTHFAMKYVSHQTIDIKGVKL